MENKKRQVDHSNKFTLKTILVAIFFVGLIVALAVYIYSYPKATIRLYNDEGVLEETVKKYKGSKLRLQDLPEIYKTGHSFTYWSYDEAGYDVVVNNTPLDEDEYDFYGHFERNTYTVDYYIQKYTSDAETDIEYELFYTDHVLYADDFTVPTGVDENTGKLTALLADRVGYTFSGWSTSIDYEEAIENNESIRVFNGGETYNYQDSKHLQLYAIWKKDSYAIKLNTGVSYKTYNAVEIEELMPNRDYIIYDNGGVNLYYAIDKNRNFIIQNDKIDTRETGGISSASIKYLDYFQTAVTPFDNYTLPENIIVGAEEYDFKGWYLSNNFEDNMTVNQSLQVEVDQSTRIPYLKGAGNKRVVNAVEVAPVNGIRQFVFNIYSKWERRSYTVSLTDEKKALTTTNIEYKVYKYDDNFGKLHTTDIDFAPLMNSFLGKDEFGNDIVGATPKLGLDYRANVTVLGSTIPYKFMSWLDSTNEEEYYYWTQSIGEADTESGLPLRYDTTYENAIYRHMTSGDITMQATWAQMYEIVYAKSYKNQTTKYNSGVYAIVGEVVDLFSYSYMQSLGGRAAQVSTATATQTHKGWVSYGNAKQVTHKADDIPTLHSDVEHCFHTVTAKDLRQQDLNAVNNFFMFFNYFEDITA